MRGQDVATDSQMIQNETSAGWIGRGRQGLGHIDASEETPRLPSFFNETIGYTEEDWRVPPDHQWPSPLVAAPAL